jgi:hypothetical protein
VRRSRVIPFAVCLALVGAGCSGSANQPRETTESEAAESETAREYTADERKWLEKLGAWRASADTALRVMLLANDDADVLEDLQTGYAPVTNEIRTALEVLRACSQTFTEQVGPAPTDRLRKAAAATKAACPDLRRGAAEDLRALDAEDPELLDAGDGFIELGAEKLWNANKQVLQRAEGRVLPSVAGASEESHVNPDLGPVADSLGENLATATEVRCWSDKDWPGILDELSAYYGDRPHGELLGFASPDLVRINLAPSICADLNELLYDEPERLDDDHALAVLALAHEAMHVAWVDDEAEATCYAVQEAERVARRLGLSRPEARTLARLAWTDSYRELPRDYQSSECADGRTLDTDPDSHAWP